MSQSQQTIIDSHIHLFPASELCSLAWWHPSGGPCGEQHPLNAQHSVAEYRAAVSTRNMPLLRGFVFVETDRRSSVQEHDHPGWEHALDEVAWIMRVAAGLPRPDEGHESTDGPLCLAIVPWAPVPGGADVLERYVARVKERVVQVARMSSEGTWERTWLKIVGFRYLVQDKPPGTMLKESFIAGLRWLGRRGYSFDLGVDMRSGGLWQLDEAVEMMRMVNEGVRDEERVVVVINHMCKPDMRESRSTPQQREHMEPSFAAWQARMVQLAVFPNTVMKLSGGFSEIEALPAETSQESLSFWDRQALLDATAEHITPWFKIVLDLWGPSRCMFGSDWPVSNIGGGGNGVAWSNWCFVVKNFCKTLDVQEAGMIWEGTATRVYKINPKPAAATLEERELHQARYTAIQSYEECSDCCNDKARICCYCALSSKLTAACLEPTDTWRSVSEYCT